MKKEKKQNFKEIFSPVKKEIKISKFLSGVSTIFYIVTLILMAYVIKTLTYENYDKNQIYMLLIGTVISVIICFVTRNKSSLISHLASYKLENALRKDLSIKATRMSQASLNESGSGGLVTVLQEHVANLHAYVADAPPLMAKAICSPIITLVLIFYLDWRLAIIDLVVISVGVILMSKIMMTKDEAILEYQKSINEVNTSIIEYIQAMPVIRTFDGGTTSFSRYQISLNNHKEKMIAWLKERSIYSRTAILIFNPMVTIFVVLWSGFYFWNSKTLDFNSWLGVLLFGAGVIDAIMLFMYLSRSIYLSTQSAVIINEFKNEPELESAKSPKVPTAKNIEFENVCFNYSNDSLPALNDVSFEVPENSFVAVVGTSGAGKSTIARLIPRFWEVTSGSIKIGGVDIREIEPNVLMDKISFVFQENYLFNDTIGNNIKLGLEDALQEDVVEAAKFAGAHEFIESLPNGYNTKVGERGSKLSGGQKQRIAIARALLQNRPILILDEATAHADTENEALLLKALSKLIQNKTVIMITHRLSTIQDADNIIVLDGGKLVDQGRHEDLIKEPNGVYNKLWEIQLATQNWVMTIKEEGGESNE